MTTNLATAGERAGFIQNTINGFQQSEFEFQRSISNEPFPPMSFLSASSYSEVEFERPNGGKGQYGLDRVSAMGAVPFLLGKRDAVFAGAYLSLSDFNFSGAVEEDFKVRSVGIPVGWIRQQNPDWQYAAFVMPMGHEANLPGSDWSWQYMGGAFARYVQTDSLWWAFGLYADIQSNDEFYIPYLGASWSINERWTLSAVMPWPAIVYAPSRDLVFRLGAAPSGASWSLESGGSGDTYVNLDSWDFGIAAQYRIYSNIWIGARAGIGGLRGLRLADDSVEEPDLDLDSNAFFGVELNFRPGVQF
ncbi:hypothetical protein E2F43_12845 [Seongchinamella unica]|uniref:Uncharacterized protein n=1 Tax=Seongchinamella unica TaxID=2547392 RepID=A0A4R5LR61_9GAMM|nr:hypothetical protein E2F43_12845 [Seongchinamella unica]